MDTFVVRIWLPVDGQDPEPPGTLKGIVEHVSDGTLMVFDGEQELLGFISQNARVSA